MFFQRAHALHSGENIRNWLSHVMLLSPKTGKMLQSMFRWRQNENLHDSSKILMMQADTTRRFFLVLCHVLPSILVSPKYQWPVRMSSGWKAMHACTNEWFSTHRQSKQECTISSAVLYKNIVVLNYKHKHSGSVGKVLCCFFKQRIACLNVEPVNN